MTLEELVVRVKDAEGSLKALEEDIKQLPELKPYLIRARSCFEQSQQLKAQLLNSLTSMALDLGLERVAIGSLFFYDLRSAISTRIAPSFLAYDPSREPAWDWLCSYIIKAIHKQIERMLEEGAADRINSVLRAIQDLAKLLETR